MCFSFSWIVLAILITVVTLDLRDVKCWGLGSFIYLMGMYGVV
jgi:hypothetical protein